MKHFVAILILITSFCIISGCVSDNNPATAKKKSMAGSTDKGIDSYMKNHEDEQLRETGGRGM